MRAVIVSGGALEVADVPEPEPGPGQLVLQVAASGICGSDLKTWGYMPDGTVLGHEFSGTVVAAGHDVAALWPVGTRAVSLPVMSCGACPDCRVGDVARCADAIAVGVGGGPGAFAERVLVSARETFRLGEAVSLETGALVEPLAVGLHALNRSRIQPDARLLVIGAGPVGLAVLAWARHLGIRESVVSDPSAERRAAALLCGADSVVDPSTEPLGAPYDVVVECVGARGMVATCIDALKPRGTAVIAGVCLEEDPFMPVVGVTKDVDLAFVSYYTHEEFGRSARLLGSGRLDPGPMITDRIGLDDVAATFERLRTPGADRKVLVVP
jgi:2-desacetyl-2-hydroxyethyl bacteriochlorophyllide A dehydrogenase